MQSFHHEPVLVEEALHYWVGDPQGRYIDGTLGGGGHTLTLLTRFPRATVLALDRDPDALEAAGERLRDVASRVELVRADFGDVARVLEERPGPPPAGMLMDLGVSSHQLDTPERGFSYHQDAPLRLVLDRDAGGDARDYLDAVDTEELRRVLREFGDVPQAGRTARGIKRAREAGRLETTGDLKAVLDRLGLGSPRRASQVFQALRMAVNDELGSLRRGLAGAAEVLPPEGRVVVISFESVMDREVKRTFRPQREGRPMPGERDPDPMWEVMTKSVVRPTDAEIERNPRARSARLRAARRTEHVE